MRNTFVDVLLFFLGIWVIIFPTPAYGADVASPSEQVSVIVLGDIMLSRGVAQKIKTKDIDYPFLKMKDFLKQGDIVFGNLEAPITPGREIKTYEMVFRANPGIEQALKDAGITTLGLANNHIMNFGAKGLTDTLKYLSGAGLGFVGAGNNTSEAQKPVIILSHGLTFAFLAFNEATFTPLNYEAQAKRPGVAFMKIPAMVKAVKEAKQKANFVIVSMHAGKEYTALATQFQKTFAHAAIDAGAEVVVGTHPHVVQNMEQYKGKYIFYSLGNFIFEQMWSKATRQGLVVKLMFSQEGVKDVEFLPVVIENFAQPRPLEGKEREKVLARLKFPLPPHPASQ